MCLSYFVSKLNANRLVLHSMAHIYVEWTEHYTTQCAVYYTVVALNFAALRYTHITPFELTFPQGTLPRRSDFSDRCQQRCRSDRQNKPRRLEAAPAAPPITLPEASWNSWSWWSRNCSPLLLADRWLCHKKKLYNNGSYLKTFSGGFESPKWPQNKSFNL